MCPVSSSREFFQGMKWCNQTELIINSLQGSIPDFKGLDINLYLGMLPFRWLKVSSFLRLMPICIKPTPHEEQHKPKRHFYIRGIRQLHMAPSYLQTPLPLPELKKPSQPPSNEASTSYFNCKQYWAQKQMARLPVFGPTSILWCAVFG